MQEQDGDLVPNLNNVHESSELPRQLIDSALDCIIMMDSSGLIRDWNHQAEETFGWTREEAIGRSLKELIVPPEYQTAHEKGIEKFLATGDGPILGKRLELSALRRNGDQFPVEIAVTPIKLESGYVFSAFLRDISDQKKIMADLRTRDLKIRSLMNSTAEGIYGIDLDGICTFANPACAALLGYDSPNEFLGLNMHELIHHTHQDGSHYPNKECRIYKAFREGLGVHVDDEVLWRQDGTSFDAEYWSYPVYDNQQSSNSPPLDPSQNQMVITGSVVTFLDISERKNFEAKQLEFNRQLEDRVRERTEALAKSNEALAQSNEDLQQFAYVASHDLQTPLRSIAGFAQFIKSDYQQELDEEAEDYLNRIINAAKRMQKMINDLLAFSRVDSRAAPFVPTDLNVVMQDVIELLGSSIEESKAKIELDNLPTVMGDASQLSQLMLNLVNNAIKYRDQPMPRIRIKATKSDTEWVVSIEDNGIGIHEDHFEKIFEVFRRLHNQKHYPGNGIGLAVCRRIVNRHGGRIWLTSELNRGSKFFYTIPIDDPNNQEASQWSI